MEGSFDFTGPPDPRYALEAAVDPVTALRLASQAATRALRHGGSDVARDVAAGALTLLLEKKMHFSPRSIRATVKHLARRTARADLARPALAPSTLEGEDLLAEGPVDAPEESGLAGEPEAPRSRTFACGSRVRLDGSLCEADISDLTLERADGSVLRDREALAAAHRLLLAERACAAGGTQQGGNAHRANEALSRDALLLSVAGLPWQEALARLAGLGVHVSRDGLRSGQRAARRRCMGLAAHA